VAFRHYTAEQARRAGVAGWVCNRPDGSVEAAFEGETSGVEALLAFVRRGPRSARVESVEEFEETPAGAASFEIRA
jgi:acylphosphatase